MSTYYIHAKHLIDGVSQNEKINQLICVEDGKIKSICDYKKVDGTIYETDTLMPGLLNCHVHVMDPVGFPTSYKFTLMEKAFYAQKNCEEYLKSGITTVRNLGAEQNFDLEIKKAINEGLIKGPHMICSGRVICMTGGHGCTNGIEADGVDECRKAARQQLKNGVDVIKVMATGGVMTKGVEPGSAQLTQEEMAAIIEEAHKAGRKTATHAQGTQGIKNALYAGIDSIEHGIFLDQECIDYMKAHGVYLVPTLVAPQCICDAGVEHGIADYMVRKANYVKDAHVDSFKRAYKQGVKIAFGTDAGTPFNYHSNCLWELELMEKYGVDRMDILKICTHNSADLIGVLDAYGTIEQGKMADLVLLNQNPLDSISNVRDIQKVIKDGEIVVDNAK